MRTTTVLAAMSAVLLGSTALAAPAVPASPVAPLAYTMRTLPNGLRVFAMPDPTTANVAVEVIYDVGAKNDPAGRSGFAHMFEHLMFKSTRDLVPEQLDRLTEDVGGNNNASTHDDFTEYHETVPANHLEPILWAEAERMGSLVVEPKVFASERNVVEEELRQGEARPYGTLFQTYLPAISYSVHPYARSPIGSIADLDSATIDDIRAFHAVYYRPDNAVLVVAGNFKPADLDRWVDKYFTNIPTPARAIPRVTTVEPPRTVATTHTVYAPNTPLPAVAISWAVPPSKSPDDAALSVLDAILSAGESSRLYESLVYRDQLASSAGANLDDRQDTGVFAVYAILAGGKSAADGEAALRREVARLRDAPPTAAELDVAKNQLLTAAIKERETPLGRANALAEAVIVDGDPASADRSVADLAAVTAADVQRVARKYLQDSASAAIRYLPAESAKGAKGDTITVAATVHPAPLTVPPGVVVVVPATAAERIAPPPPAAPVAVPVPVVAERTLPNGLRVAVATRRNVPLIAAVLVTSSGAANDPAGRGGTAELAATLLTKGTATRSATQIAQEIEALGGNIGAGASWDGTTLSMTVKTDRIGAAMAVFADVARHPKFAADEIERARTQAIDDAGIALTSPPSLARMTATKAVFGDTTYGHIASGTIKSLKAITHADLTAAYAGWNPAGATLIMTGDIDLDGAVALATKAFGDWAPGKAETRPAPAAATYPKPRTIVVDLPGAAQASVVVARPGLARADPAYYSAIVANAALGGGFSSRLNMEIRVKRGLAYGANSGIDARRGVGSLTASTATKNASAPEVAGLIASELKKMGTTPVPLPELHIQQAVLNGGFGRSVETVSGLAGRLAGLAIDGIPLGELARFSPSVNAVTPGTITATAATLFDPALASTIIVGDAKQFLPELAKAGITAEVIPAARLDLDSATLGK
ncbi:insulinase family protein [Polymorphobacter sp. PAMC 29334]|uniref:M16 family metallopeptidase n=1 Tax=Polymorphobacter sp. PAMC 29334 TaxID=2862331 RepID=UPI001C684B20|nr:pitrilysin family protein [Polymorphobacter sp. PAMC 29334]QYE35984.1 insulinase family protein [Polymorphobacter sp. PAMC 29334]